MNTHLDLAKRQEKKKKKKDSIERARVYVFTFDRSLSMSPSLSLYPRSHMLANKFIQTRSSTPISPRMCIYEINI